MDNWRVYFIRSHVTNDTIFFAEYFPIREVSFVSVFR